MLTADDYYLDPTGHWRLRRNNTGNDWSSQPMGQALTSHGPKALELYWANDIGPEPEPGEQNPSLWGDFLMSQSIHLLSGEAGVGKTTLLYNLAIKACTGDDFLGILFTSPLRVLYIDLETPHRLWRNKIRLISDANPPHNLAFIFLVSLNKDITQLIQLVEEFQFDLVVVDSINEAFQTMDEDDNAEANRQMALVRQLTQETGAAVVLVHHIGKSEQSRKVYRGRGASARAASADVVLNLESISDEVIRLEMVKNRWIGGTSKLFLRKMGEDIFEPTEVIGEESVAQKIKVQSVIRHLLEKTPKGMSTKEIKAECQHHNFASATIERALSGLVQVGKVRRIKRGVYYLPKDFIKTSITSTPNDGVIDGSVEGEYVTEKI